MSLLSRLALVSLATAGLHAGAAEAQKSLLKDSPFASPAPAAGLAPASETLEFAGVSAVGKRTDIILYDKTAKKSHWIGIGEAKEGISVVSYDSAREQAVVKINGAEKVLTLRKGNGPTNRPAAVAPMPVGFNVATPVPAVAPATAAPTPAGIPGQPPAAPPPVNATAPASNTPEAQQRQETEARMLVSDLLEIGMAQRKAYEEAQRKAAQGNAEAAAQPDPTQQAQPAQPPKQ